MASPPFRADRPIVLVGLMGAGKSTVGRRLASRLGLPFADADREIERAAGRSVAEIFDDFGEEVFRDGERRVIARLTDGGPKVIAAGGGAFVDEATRALILERCVAIWLDAKLDTLAERVARRDTRPLVRGQDPRAALDALAARRTPLYAQAHLQIRTDEGSHEAAVERIVAELARSAG